MFIKEVHDYTPAPAKVVDEWLSKNRRDQVKKVVEEIVDDQFTRLEEYANEHISQVAARRAEKFLELVLSGDKDAAMALLGDDIGGSRYRDMTGDPWAKLIHGRLFESSGVALRRKIVEAHSDLLCHERIKDLESIVEGLTLQVKTLTADNDRLHGVR